MKAWLVPGVIFIIHKNLYVTYIIKRAAAFYFKFNRFIFALLLYKAISTPALRISDNVMIDDVNGWNQRKKHPRIFLGKTATDDVL